MHLPRLVLLALLLPALAGLSAPARAAGPHGTGLWLHVAVDEQDGEGSTVRVTLPLTLVEGVLPFLNGDHSGHLRVSDVDDLDLRQAWEAARSAPKGRFIEIPTKGKGTLHVAHLDDQLVFRALDEDSVVHVRVPWKVAEKLAATSSDGTVDVDLPALVRALREFGPGELLTAEATDSTIRLWIDEKSGDVD
jgi:hypothetical protein